MKTAAIYARVSTADQVKGTSLDGQVALCHDYAKEHGFSVVKVMQEDASGARLDRPKLGELRNMADRHEFEALIVSDPDRLSRSMAHTMILMEEFERNKAGVLFVNAPCEDTPEGEMLFGMWALFAQYERTKIIERTRRGRERRVNEGRIMMSRVHPFGYRYIAGEYRLEVIPEEAMWVVKMYEWLVHEGSSLREIARRLEANNVPTKGGADHWYAGVVQHILANEVYAGTWHFGKRAAVEPKAPKKANRSRVKSSRELKPRSEWLSVAVPALVPQELFDAVQERLQRNRAMSTRNSKYPYLLRGMVICTRCGYRMYGHAKHPTAPGGPRLVYDCTGRFIKYKHLPIAQRCTQPTTDASRLEGLLWDEVVAQLSDGDRLRKKLEEREAQRQNGRRGDEAELEALFTLEAGLKREADKLVDLHMGDVIDRQTLQERMAVVREKQDSLAKSKAEVTQRLAQREQGGDSDAAIKQLCEVAKAGLPHLDYEEKRAFLEGMDVLLHIDGDQVTITGLIIERTLSLANK
jgi:site-specific DNA recombinase